MDAEILAQLPEDEICWVRCYNSEQKLTHVITSTMLRNMYFLYETKDGALVKTKHQSKNPLDFDEFITS